ARRDRGVARSGSGDRPGARVPREEPLERAAGAAPAVAVVHRRDRRVALHEDGERGGALAAREERRRVVREDNDAAWGHPRDDVRAAVPGDVADGEIAETPVRSRAVEALRFERAL